MLVIKNSLIALGAILVMDAIWLGYIARPLYVKGLGDFMHIQDGSVYINYMAAGVVYLCLAVGIAAFVLPKSNGLMMNALVWGGLFGLLVYAVYDMTNMSIMPKWPLWISIIDILWGSFLCAVCSAVVVWFNAR
jgi:uncharacterized membrane protein